MRLNPADGGPWQRVTTEFIHHRLASPHFREELTNPKHWLMLSGGPLVDGSIGLILFKSAGSRSDYVVAYINIPRRIFSVPHHYDLYDPRFGATLLALREDNLFQDFRVWIDQVPWSTGIDESRRITGWTVAELSAQLKVVVGAYRKYDQDRDNVEYDTFKMTVARSIADQPSYHATRMKSLRAIRRDGLLPSGSFPQGSGWTQLNMNLQRAVYLSLNYDYASEVAETLACRHDDRGVVLEVDPAAFDDWSKLVVDEDQLLEEHGMRYPSGEFPDFVESLTSFRGSFGYAGRIDPRHLSIAQRVACPFEDESDEDERS